ncbi:MAG: mechanosensitive ion channel family protein [Nitrospiraceae bacterium]
MPQDWMSLMMGPVQQLLSEILVKLPSVLAALLLLLIGMVVGKIIRAAVEKFLKFVRVDEYTEKVKVNELLARLGFGQSPAFVVGFLVYWLIILVFLVSAANAVQLTVVSQLLERFVLFIPKLIGAVVIVASGLLLGHFFGEVVLNAATANKLDSAVAFSKTVRVVVVVFAGVMAIEQIGIDTTIITSSIQIILGTIGLAVAIAFGMGGKDVAAEIVKNFVARQSQRRT